MNDNVLTIWFIRYLSNDVHLYLRGFTRSFDLPKSGRTSCSVPCWPLSSNVVQTTVFITLTLSGQPFGQNKTVIDVNNINHSRLFCNRILISISWSGSIYRNTRNSIVFNKTLSAYIFIYFWRIRFVYFFFLG